MPDGTKLFHPGNPMDEQRNGETRRSVADAVLRLETSLLGHPDQPYMGAIPRIEAHLEDQGKRLTVLEAVNAGPRLDAMEGRIWKSLVGALVALIGVVWQWLSHKG